MSQPNLVRSYRAVLRQFQKSAIKPRQERNQAIASQLRTLFEEQRSAKTIDEGFQQQMMEMGEFLKAGRIYNELLLRYNPTHEMTPAEKTAASARRVGMEEPVQYDASQRNEKL